MRLLCIRYYSRFPLSRFHSVAYITTIPYTRRSILLIPVDELRVRRWTSFVLFYLNYYYYSTFNSRASINGLYIDTLRVFIIEGGKCESVDLLPVKYANRPGGTRARVYLQCIRLQRARIQLVQ